MPAARGSSLPASTFAFGIGNGMLDALAAATADRLGPFDLVVVDGQEVTAADVAALHERGTTVLAYLSAGTIESYRPWYAKLKPYRLEPLDDWDEEWYANVSKPGFRQAIATDIAPSILAKGVDGLFLDNVDMIETHSAAAPGDEGPRRVALEPGPRQRTAPVRAERPPASFADRGCSHCSTDGTART